MADLKIRVTAETDKAAKAIISFVASVERETDSATGAFTQLDAAIQKVGKDAAKSLPASIGPLKQAKISADQLKNSLLLINGAEISATKSFKNLSTSAKGTTNTLTNFGRVIQDAPFGIIGIANNIDPLISSFQNLRKETGSNGAAFKALASGLLGPAGIAIGVSAVTSALIAFGPAISDAINGVSKFEAAQRDAGQKGAEAFKLAQIEFQNFSDTINSSSASFNLQKNALEGVNGILAEYGLEIKTVADFQRAGNQVGIVYAQIKQNEARSTALADAAAKDYAATIANTSAVTKQAETIATGSFFQKFLAFQPGQLLALGKGIAQTEKSVKLQADFGAEIKKLNEDNIKLIEGLSKVEGVTQKVDASKKNLTKSVKELTAADKENAAFLAQQLQTGTANLSVIKATNAENEKALANQKARNAAQAVSQFGAGLGPNSFAAFDPTKLFDNAKLQAYTANLAAADLATANAVNSINKSINSLAVDALASFGTAIGVALSGGGIADGIKAFGAIVGSAIGNLGKELIALGTTITLVKNATSALSGPGLIIGGVALVAIGAALNNLLASGPKLARGGITTGPTRALIGEGGPEAVIPLSQLARLVGGGGSRDVNVNGRLSGNLIYLSNQRGGASFSRLFG